MATFGAAYELQFNREAAGAAIPPTGCRLYTSLTPWADASSILKATLDRGYIPFPATGDTPVVRRISGLTSTAVGSPASLAGNARDAFAAYGGASTASSGSPGDFIQRCGYNNYTVGRGRAAPGDVVVAAGALRTAILNGSAATVLNVDCFAGVGISQYDPNGTSVWNTSALNGSIWQSHLGIYDFVDDAVDQNTRQNALFDTIATNGNQYVLPNGTVVKDCNYAAVSPEGMVWILASDYGINVPSDVTLNTANAFRNHPAVFVRRAGGAFVRAVNRRWRDRYSLVTPNVGSQPIGILQLTDPVVRSKWLVVIDGVAEVVWLAHPANTDYRRPVDIWNNVITSLISNSGSNVNRIAITDFYGNAIGTETRWQFLSYARYLGSEGTTQQTNTILPG